MKAAAFEYVRPRGLDEAVKRLGEAAEGGKLLAGGQSLGPMLNLRLARPRLLVDISRLEELRGIEDMGSAWRIGAGVTHAELEDADGTLAGCEMIVRVAAGIAYRSVRNRGTIGGSLAHADPAGDWPLALAALDAEVAIRGPRGERTLRAESFMKAAFTTELADDEIVTVIVVPKLSASARFGYFKFCRKTGEFPDASAAVILDPERRVARVFLGALNGRPQALPTLARAVAERGAAACTREAAHEAVGSVQAFDAVDRRMHAATLLRALQQVCPS
jgi:aerobic carbon-monoxide dehydrogenase medium subunit